MRKIRLAYRDHDRTPVIYCIKEMARRHYDLDVEIVHLPGSEEFESALFNGACDVIIEHNEYLYAETAKGAKVSLFCAPILETGLELVVRPDVQSIEELRGGKIAVRTHGRRHVPVMRLRAMGLAESMEVVLVEDRDVGRWRQWTKVVDGTCAATFVSPLYLPQAEAAGLVVIDTADIDIIGLFAQACLSSFASENGELMRSYVKSVLHALALITRRWPDAMEIARGEPMRLMKLDDPAELERQFRAMTRAVNVRPYPTVEATRNGYEVVLDEFPPPAEVNPLTLWDLHWVKELDDSGFIDELLRD